MKLKFKPKLVPIFVQEFLLCFSTGFSMPYLTLLLRSLGLTLADASLVNGLSPIFSGVLSPIIGYLGDKLGFKLILILVTLGMIGSSTSLNFIPVYREYDAKIGLDKNFYNDMQEIFDSRSIIWFGKYQESKAGCEYNASRNVIKQIVCDDKVFDTEIVFSVDDIENTLSDSCTDLNVQTCKYFVQDETEKDYKICDVNFKEENGKHIEGSHKQTFWIYFALKTIFSLLVNVNFNLSDSAASIITIREGSSFAMVLIVSNVAELIPNWIVGPIVDHFSFGTDYTDCLTQQIMVVNDFKLPFFIQNAFLLVATVIIFFFLDVNIKKPEKKLSIKSEFSWLFNPATIGFFVIMTIAGMEIGVMETYFYIFAQEDLGASATFLGYIQFASSLMKLLLLPFAKSIIEYTGPMNTILMFWIIVMSRSVAIGLTYTSPPYPFIAYAVMDACRCYFNVAVISYTSVIAPQSLYATAISIGSVFMWIVGRGVGSLLAGIVVEEYNISVMFIVFGIGGCSIFLAYWILYHLVIKKFEANQNDKEDDTKSNNSCKDDLRNDNSEI